MAVEVDIDVEVLKCEIKKTYARVSEEPDHDFIFPTGRAWAEDLGYPSELLARVPETTLRRCYLERRHRPHSRQGRGLLRDPPRSSSRRSHPDRRRDDPEPGFGGRAATDRPLDWLNCRRSAGSRVRTASQATWVR